MRFVSELMCELMINLMRTDISFAQVHIYFNTYILGNVFFTHRIVEFIDKKIIELKRICKNPILKR